MAYLDSRMKIVFSTFTVLCVVCLASSHFQQRQTEGVYQHDFKWPVTLSFQESKTNNMLGEVLLKRLYARIGFTDNIIRAEIDNMFDNLKELLEKRLRKCERRRRRAGKTSGYESPYSSVLNASLANQYSPRGRNYYGTNPY